MAVLLKDFGNHFSLGGAGGAAAATAGPQAGAAGAAGAVASSSRGARDSEAGQLQTLRALSVLLKLLGRWVQIEASAALHCTCRPRCRPLSHNKLIFDELASTKAE